MTAHADARNVVVRLKKNATEAWLEFRPAPAARPSKAECLAALREAEVQINATVEQAVDAALANGETGDSALVATSTPVRHGADGWIEWTVDVNAAPQATFYERSPYVQVTAGQRVGRVHPPTAGEDGCDVRGRIIAARSGRPAPVKLDESLLADAKGTITSMRQGLLVRSSTSAKVGNVLKTGGRVDFATGNIDFDGDVEIDRGVSDCFVVRATGSVTVNGVVEAATVHCRGDLTCTGGFAAKGSGKASVGGDLVAGQINALEATVGGDLRVEHEAIDCTLKVGGAIASPGATFCGGVTECGGAARIGTLGRPSGIRSTLVVDLGGPGPDPVQIAALTRDIEKMTGELQQLQARGAQMSAGQKERLTELQYELHERNGRLAQLRAPLLCSDKDPNELKVENAIHANSILVLSGETFVVGTAIRGPVTIRREGKEFVIDSRAGVRPLRQYAQRRLAA